MSDSFFKSKAKTLEELTSLVKKSIIEPLLRFDLKAWRKNQDQILIQISHFFKGMSVVIRSSSLKEDLDSTSNAGHFTSILNIKADNITKLKSSIDQVCISMGDLEDNEFFIQKFISAVSLSGVVFTRGLSDASPYYIINYDDQTSETDTVTSGCTNELKTLIVYREKPLGLGNIFHKLISSCKEIEAVVNSTSLDIEFAIGLDSKIYIFQVRPLIIKKKTPIESLDIVLNRVAKKIDKLNGPHPHLLGDKTMFGVMPDWNPAEILGLKPKRLALSLYKYLITDRTWAYQRDNYGYRNLRSFPLLISFLGVPYIDIRVSFNSFIPKTLEEPLAKKLVNYYINQLGKFPNLHDKVEFEIIYSCYYFGISEKLKGLSENGFDEKEIHKIEHSLLTLTNKITNPENGIFKQDLEKINQLNLRRDDVLDSDMPTIDKIYWLLEDCNRYGTLPFAGLARCGFIAMQLLNSLLNIGLLRKKDYENFMASISTVSKGLIFDLHSYFTQGFKKNDFLKKYGHLRPGTYDITESRYDENFDRYFSKKPIIPKSTVFSIDSQTSENIELKLKDNKLEMNTTQLFSFIRQSIEGRESLKFEFSKNISEILLLVEELGVRYNISRNDLAFLDIQTIATLYSTVDHRGLEEILKNDIQKNKDYYEYTKTIKFPPLINQADDIYSFHLEDGTPNFVTNQQIISKCQEIKTNTNPDYLKDKIVFIESADPGFDWIFSKNIAGLITMFGGANSHMAIRCAELNIPAVIGAGEKKYNNWKNAQVIELNAHNQWVKVIS
jgi:glutamine kinase